MSIASFVAIQLRRPSGRIAGLVERLLNPYPDGYFTKVCTVNTIYFWADADAVLSELRRVLATGGRLVVCFNPKVTAEKLPFTKHSSRCTNPRRWEA